MRIRAVLALIFLLALLLRVGFILFYENGTMRGNAYHAGDEASYDQLAVNLLAGKGFVTDDGLRARRAPAYPLMLAAIYWVFGHVLFIARLAQALLGALTCLVVYGIGRRIFCQRVGVIAGFICAGYYPLIQYPAYLLTEVFFTFLLTVTVLFFTRYYDERRNRDLFSASLVLGLAVLCRVSVLYFIVFLAAWLGFLFRFNIAKASKPVAILAGSVMLVVFPWVARNCVIYKTFVPVTIESGMILYYGNNPRATGGTGGWTKNGIDQFLPEDIGDPFTPQADRRLLRLAARYMIAHPVRTIELAGRKFFNMWRPFYADARLANKIIMVVEYIPIMVLAAFGLWQSFSCSRKRYIVLYGVMAYFVFLNMVTIADIRYRYPLMPFVILFSAFAAVEFCNRLRLGATVKCKQGAGI